MSEDRSRVVAVIGMAGRFPGAPDVDAYWRNIVSGTESISPVPDKTPIAGGGLTSPRCSKWIGMASAVEGIEEFDAEYFGMSRMEAETLDPQQRILLECAVHAFDSAGYDARRFDGAVGVYVGVGFSTYLADNIGSRADLLETYDRLQLLHGNDKDYGATRISYYLNLRGPSMAISCACSTSLVCIHQACTSLLSHECDLALAGGAKIDVSARRGYQYREGGILSADGHCRPFDAKASGTVFGSGAGLVLLRRYEDAVEAGDNICALILGSSVNNDGSGKLGYAAPGFRGQANVIAEALAMADVSSDTIGYVEGNGTSTRMGDAAEIAALTRAFARMGSGRSKPFCAVGSVKANIGHLDVAAGVAGFIKVVQALRHREIPPCVHFEAVNPQIRLENGPFFINSKPLNWAADRTPRRAGVSAFGIGGTNAHVILEEAPPRSVAGFAAEKSMHVLTLSGHKPEALEILRARHAQLLAAPTSEQQFADICATSHLGRAHHRHRIAVVAGPAITASNLLADRSDPGEGYMLRGVVANRPLVRFEMDPISIEQVSRLGACEDAPGAFRRAWRICETAVGGGTARAKLFAAYYAMAATFRAWGISPVEISGNSVGVLAAKYAFAEGIPDRLDRLLAEFERETPETAATQAARGVDVVMHLGDRVVVKDLRSSRHEHRACDRLSEQFLLAIAKLYVSGFEIDWKTFNSDRAYRRVELPAYPFVRKRFWIDPAASGTSPAPAAHADAPRGLLTQESIERQLLLWFDDARTTPAEDMNDDRLIASYGIDSLRLLDLLTRISRHFQIDLSLFELKDVETVDDLARLVAQKASPIPIPDEKPPAVRIRTYPEPNGDWTKRLAENYRYAFAACSGFREHLLEQADGGTTEILDMGAGPPILLLPPFGCLGVAFVYQARYLSQSHRVLMFHYPGCGRSSPGGDRNLQSTASSIASCLHHLAPGAACHILGWSLGGIVGQVLACERPDLVKSLTLVNTSAKLDGDGSLAGMTSTAQFFMDDFRENMPEWMRDRLEGQFDFFRASESAVATSRLLAAAQAFDGRQRLGVIVAPALVVAGGLDRITPARHGRDLAERLCCATYKELATGGHYVPLFNADWFNAQLTAFIDPLKP